MQKKCTWMLCLTAVTGLAFSLAANAQDGGATTDEQVVEAQEADVWGDQPVQAEPPALEPEWTEPEPAAPMAVNPAMEMQQIQMQLQQISMQLSHIQQQALEVQDVMDAIQDYETRLRAKMLALSPDVEDDIRQAEGLVEELRAVADPSALSPEEVEEFQEKYMEFLQTTQRLQPIEREARMDPEMQDAQAELEDMVKEAMRNVDPGADAIMEEQEELIERYIELEQQQQQRMAPQDQPFEVPEF